MKTITLLLMLAAAPTLADDGPQAPQQEALAYRWVGTGFVQGHEFLGLSLDARRTYVTGVVDGLSAAGLLLATDERSKWFAACVDRRSNDQIEAMTSKWLRDHPERWHLGANSAVYDALAAACPSK